MEKKKQRQIFHFNQNVAILGNSNDSCANVPPTSISSCLRQWGLPGLSVFILKTQKSVYGPWVIQNTKHSLKVKKIY